MGRRPRRGSQSKTDTVSMAQLEVVSAENFQRRLAGMSCVDCLRERERAWDYSNPSNSGSPGHSGSSGHTQHRHRRRGSRLRLHTPIVVRLQDTIKVSVRNKLRQKSVDVDSDQSSDDGLPTRKETISLNNHQIGALRSLRDSKNYNAFLSAIERVHMKEKGSFSANLEEYIRAFKDNKNLNNSINYHTSSSSKLCSRSLEFIDKENVAFICNDLSGKGSPADSDSAQVDSDSTPGDSDTCSDESEIPSEDSSVISSTEETISDSDLSSGSESVSEEGLSRSEVERLAHYTTGYSVTKYDCAPHDCPECLSAFYAPQHSDSDSDSACDSESRHKPCFEVTIVGQGKVEVSVAALHMNKQKRRRSTQGWEHRHRPNGVYVDITDSDMSFTVQYHKSTSTPHRRRRSDPQNEPSQSLSARGQHDWYNAYPYGGGVLGYIPFSLPFCLMPVYYIPYPINPMPKPLCVPRSTSCLESQRLCMVPANEVEAFTASQPPQRPWLPLTHPERNKPIAIYTVMCYNVLCDKYATRQLYGYCPTWALNWEYRKKGIIEEIRHYSADILTLQEIETDQFYNFFLPELKRDGYDGIFSPKSRARTMSETDRKHVDGCAIFFRTTKFALIKEHLIEFNQLAMASAEGSHDMLNRVMTKDNIGLAALLETKEAIWENGLPPETQVRQPVLVATCHVHWDPEFSDVKLIQTMLLMSELKNIIDDSQMSLRPRSSTTPEPPPIPLMLCGDLNSLPESGVVEYLENGRVAANHCDFKDLGYENCLQKLGVNTESKDMFTHGFKLAPAYTKEVIACTNYTFDFKGVIDYIFYSRDCMRTLGVLGPLDQDWFTQNKVLGCPHPHIPSDHLPLLCEIELQPPQSASMANSTNSSTNSGSNSSSNNTNTRNTGMHHNVRR